MAMIQLTKGLIPFWDDYLIDSRFTDAVLSVNRPVKTDSVMKFDLPWEEDASSCFNIIKDGDIYRLYYLACKHLDISPERNLKLCYAESRDGLHWEKPNLGICEYSGSCDNNILMMYLYDNISIMKDENPDCPPEERYKALMDTSHPEDYPGYVPAETRLRIPTNHPKEIFSYLSKRVLVYLSSPDGIHFKVERILHQGYSYDSENTLHWNPHTKKYYIFFRELHANPQSIDPRFNEEWPVRGIMVTESEDFVHWSEPKSLDFMGGEDVPLYFNCITAYPYDTRYYVGFPTRYNERRGWTKNYDRLCDYEGRKERSKIDIRFGTALTDCLFMSSRDLLHWYRFDEACLTPGPERGPNWRYGDCYPALGEIIETPSRFKGEPNELSIYLCEHYEDGAELIRYVYRRDGFASIKADYQPTRLTTKPFTFEGGTLTINFRTSARGCIDLTVTDEYNVPIPGYSSGEIFGDALDRTVDFDKPLSELQGRNVRFVFTMRDAEIFALHLL